MKRSLLSVLVALATACASSKAGPPTGPTPEKKRAPPGTPGTVNASPAPTPPTQADGSRTPQPAVEPPVAFMLGLMPLKSTGVDVFRTAHPNYDGRGVLIAILDSGLDPGVPGLITTSTGAPKVIELRDFSGEGRVTLAPFAEPTESEMHGAARIGRLTTATTWYRGVFRELPLGRPPAGDVNGNGRNTDIFPVVVVKASDGWVAFIDTNLDGSFEDEMPLHDYRQGRETIALGTRPLTLVANFNERDGVPTLDLFFDTSGHGTHVAGIAAGYNLFNVTGFHGVAPGAQLIGLKIANNARGGVSVHGSMMRAIDYAARFAAQRNLPLVLNLSFGVGNEHEGRAVIDSIVDAFLLTHPEVVFAISAGNDGPGLSTMGFPGSADLALSVGATYPGVFAQAPKPGVPPARDVLGWFSARGGELAKPDIVTPGVAFSTVPPWATGGEIKGGTSMAAPHAAGLVACLVSAMAQEGRRTSAAELIQALRVSAHPFSGARIVDQGAGTPVLELAYQWLKAGHQGSTYGIHATTGASAAYRRNGLAGPADTLETFAVRHLTGLRAAQFVLRADVAWLGVEDTVDAAPRVTQIPVRYRRSALMTPGVYVGTVTALNPRDTLAGPLFTLVNTVIVPLDLASKPLFDERRAVGPAAVQRYFLRVAQPGATLRATVTVPDSQSQQATVRLYEPNGAPARSAPQDVDIGGRDDPGTAVVTVRGEDLVPGVYELDVIAPPLAAVTATVRADLGPVALTAVTAGSASLEASSVLPGSGTVTGEVIHRLVGAERTYTVAGRGQPAETLLVRAPAWTKRVEVDVDLSPDLWDELTDFSVTVYDSTEQQVRGGNEAVNYAFGRLSFALPDSLAGRLLTVELYPAFARIAAHPWRGTARIRFLGPDEPVGEGGEIAVVAGGRVAVKVPAAPALELPDGFGALIETRVSTQAGAVAARRSTVPGGAR
ncbi:MAG TPA: S8 family serine peptidase [Gemmatimonadales bacterium]|nr:S8 family serine peptidase [Gemmatimonadales bacterium]